MNEIEEFMLNDFITKIFLHERKVEKVRLVLVLAYVNWQ